MANIGPDGHPIPEQQGIVDAVMVPPKPQKPAGESMSVAHGQALDADGNPIDQNAEWCAAHAAAVAAEASKS